MSSFEKELMSAISPWFIPPPQPDPPPPPPVVVLVEDEDELFFRSRGLMADIKPFSKEDISLPLLFFPRSRSSTITTSSCPVSPAWASWLSAGWLADCLLAGFLAGSLPLASGWMEAGFAGGHCWTSRGQSWMGLKNSWLPRDARACIPLKTLHRFV